jgi:hypothetical protein
MDVADQIFRARGCTQSRDADKPANKRSLLAAAVCAVTGNDSG